MDPEGPNNDCWVDHRLGLGVYFQLRHRGDAYVRGICRVDPSLSDFVKSPSGAAEFQEAPWLVL
eukprot:8132350-Pyramimonas_sp.AAC.1